MAKEATAEAVHAQMRALFTKAAAARKEGKLAQARTFRAGARRLQRVQKAEKIKAFQMKRNEKKGEVADASGTAPVG